MLLTTVVALVFVTSITALPAVPSSENAVASFNITENGLAKRAPYGYVCNNENPPLDWGNMLACYTAIHDAGVLGHRCGAQKFVEVGRVKVMGSLWQTTDNTFTVPCVEASEAIRTVMNLCQGRGGKLYIPSTGEWRVADFLRRICWCTYHSWLESGSPGLARGSRSKYLARGWPFT